MTTYLIYRGSLLVGVAETLADAEAHAEGPNTRIVVRRGIRPWWRRPADWRVLA